MVITLIGYRGSGKTTVAQSLAARLGWSWIDADAVIEDAAGCTIKEIFAAEGESGFRDRERRALAELLTRDKLVLAAGGGAIL
ncbi:MAG TPA: shikimate kinase, partial [Planctomycetaceae bacterium]